MRSRHRALFVALVAALLAVGTAGCGDDDAEDANGAFVDTFEDTADEDPEVTEEGSGTPDDSISDPEPEVTENETPVDVPIVASGDPAEPCTLLDAASFEAALAATIDEPEEASDRFVIAGPEVESHACQWMATGAGAGGTEHVYSVELIVIPNDADGEVYASHVRSARSFGDEVTELDLGDEAIGVVTDGSPEVIVRTGEALVVLRTASDDLGIDEFVLLAEAAVGAVEAN